MASFADIVEHSGNIEEGTGKKIHSLSYHPEIKHWTHFRKSLSRCFHRYVFSESGP
jgi:hypothetical protein